MSDTLDFSYRPDSSTARGAFRASLPGLSVRLATGERFQVKDISAGGLSVYAEGRRLRSDAHVIMELYVAERLFLGELKAHLVRMVDGDVAAYSFVELSRQQEFRLDKLVLSMQKHMIAMRKARGQEA